MNIKFERCRIPDGLIYASEAGRGICDATAGVDSIRASTMDGEDRYSIINQQVHACWEIRLTLRTARTAAFEQGRQKPERGHTCHEKRHNANDTVGGQRHSVSRNWETHPRMKEEACS